MTLDRMERVSRMLQPPAAAQLQTGQAPAGGFGAVLRQELLSGQSRQEVVFSKHAVSRVEDRRIEITPELLDRLADGVVMAQSKGATNILAVDRNRAFIINVPSAKVITAISQEEMQENIFTNIDGAVFLK